MSRRDRTLPALVELDYSLGMGEMEKGVAVAVFVEGNLATSSPDPMGIAFMSSQNHTTILVHPGLSWVEI